MQHKHPVNLRHLGGRSTGERVADAVSAKVGSWPFIITQSTLLVAWIIYNGYVALQVLHGKPFDPFPFILLNLALSFQAAYTGPIVMMSQNRQSVKDRDMAEHDFEVNKESYEHLIWQTDQILQLLKAVDRSPTSAPPGRDMNY
ncbi:MAG: DUF1003 domain-containing protein [Actinomycetota bacterium]